MDNQDIIFIVLTQMLLRKIKAFYAGGLKLQEKKKDRKQEIWATVSTKALVKICKQ